jgi:hypothetical protein
VQGCPAELVNSVDICTEAEQDFKGVELSCVNCVVKSTPAIFVSDINITSALGKGCDCRYIARSGGLVQWVGSCDDYPPSVAERSG